MGKFKYLVLSDIHFGNGRTSSDTIVDNLYMFFKRNHYIFSKLDVIFLAGDIFDRLLSSSSSDILLANEFLTLLSKYCIKYGIKLRILEGTPSHDMGQAKLFSGLVKNLDIDLDYDYITTVKIEYLSESDIYVLYIPDEMNIESNETMNEIKELMLSINIDKVDICIMHGAFKYQIPMFDSPSTFVESQMLNIVKYYISVGHIHTRSVYKRIVAQGSFDRLSHGEEEDKGGAYFTIDKVNEISNFLFIDNTDAQIYRSVVIDTDVHEDILDIVSRAVSDLSNEDNIRLIMDKDNPFIKSLSEIRKLHTVRLTVKTNKVGVKNSESIEDTLHTTIPTTIELREDNIYNLLMTEIGDVNNRTMIEDEVKMLIKGS